jgi:hypothetical protein
MKVKEVTVSRSGTISGAAYENLKPGYSVTMELGPKDDVKAVLNRANVYLRTMFEQEANRCKADLLDQQYSHIRLYEKDGMQYPSVTSVLYYCGGVAEKLAKARMTDDEMSQYAARGTVVGEIVETFLATKKWLHPEKNPSLAEDVAVLKNGSLGLHWGQCSHKSFCEKFAEEIVVEETQKTVYNTEHLYAGTLDIVGLYQGVKSLMDVKCGAFDWPQLAAYAMCLEGIEQLVVLPVGKTDNKCGYIQPKVCTTIQKEYEEFLKARAKFKQRFGL